MRFKCGGCDTRYTVDDLKIPAEGATLKCRKCDNKFTVDKNHIITDIEKGSRRFCINCGYVALIDAEECPQCNLRFKLNKASWIIDESEYHDLSYQLVKQNVFKQFRIIIIVALVVIIVAAFFWINSRQPVVEPQQFTGKFLISLIGGNTIEAVSFDFVDDQMVIINTQGEHVIVDKADFVRLSNL